MEIAGKTVEGLHIIAHITLCVYVETGDEERHAGYG